MTVGIPVTKQVIDAQAGSVCTGLRDALNLIKRFKAFLDLNNDAALIALGYVQAEVTLLRSNFTVLDQFRQCWEGSLAIASPVNIQGFTTPFIGVN